MKFNVTKSLLEGACRMTAAEDINPSASDRTLITDQFTDNSVLEKVEVMHVKNASPLVQGQKLRGFFDLIQSSKHESNVWSYKRFLSQENFSKKKKEPCNPFFVCLHRGRQ
jgi:hypothetical protein